MRKVSILTGFAVLILAGGVGSQPAEKLKSGPQVGATLPGPFASINVNGDGKDRPRCLVTLYGSDPVIMVIAREPADGKDAGVMELMKKLDGFIAKHRERDLRGFMVFLSGDARSNPDEKDQTKLVEEAQAREALILRLEPRTKGLKEVIVAAAHQAPPKYAINDKAEVTVIYYRKHVVEANFAFAPGQLTSAEIDRILQTVDKMLPKEMD
jgi:hypothetical protein